MKSSSHIIDDVPFVSAAARPLSIGQKRKKYNFLFSVLLPKSFVAAPKINAWTCYDDEKHQIGLRLISNTIRWENGRLTTIKARTPPICNTKLMDFNRPPSTVFILHLPHAQSHTYKEKDQRNAKRKQNKKRRWQLTGMYGMKIQKTGRTY